MSSSKTTPVHRKATEPGRQFASIRRRIATVGGLVLTVATAACGTTAHSPSAGAARAAATKAQANVSGRLDIGSGRKMYVECRGNGSPTLVLISGLQIAGDLWDSPLGKSPKVFPTLAKTTHVCVYDRPGTTRARSEGGVSRSDPVPQPITTQNSVTDLHALLHASHQAGPYVLVAHSYGGLVARLYAHEHPTQVAGMVLVDTLSPEFKANMSAQQWSTWKKANAPAPSAVAEYPDLERLDFDKALRQVADARSIPQMPLVVLTADEPVDPKGFPPGIPDSFARVIDHTQHVAQSEVAKLVKGARWVTATHSGHNIMLDNPVLVFSSARAVIEAVRHHRTSMKG